jgi:hypothetical protein
MKPVRSAGRETGYYVKGGGFNAKESGGEDSAIGWIQAQLQVDIGTIYM